MKNNSFDAENKNQVFRNWLSNMWYDHKNELDSFNIDLTPGYDLKDYFNNNKWWLKSEFKKKLKQDNYSSSSKFKP